MQETNIQEILMDPCFPSSILKSLKKNLLIQVTDQTV